MMHAALGLWIVSAVICLGSGYRLGDGKADETTTLKVEENNLSLVNAANKEFAFRLYQKLAAHADSQGKNVFYSPICVSFALAALSVGARGETHRQLFSGLGFNDTLLTQTDVDQAFKTLLDIEKSALSKDFSDGTAVFVDNRFTPRPEFLQTLMQSYFVEGFKVDFTKTIESAETINKYVREKTNGKIDELVKSLDPSTAMYLLSSIYFKGTWATPFEPVDTKEDKFNVDENTKVPVKMMNLEDRFDTYSDETIDTSVLHLPFNSSYSMLLLLPDNMATLENAVSPNYVTKWLRSMTPRKYNIYVPKFSIKTSYSLVDVLTGMGMTDMFDARADFSGIAEAQNLAVSDVVHKATLDVDEAGATATAATGIGIAFASLDLEEVPVLKFDRPFMVLITDRSTEEILFMGKIVNPAE